MALVVLMSSSTVWGNDKGPKRLIIIYESLYTNQRVFAGAPCVTYLYMYRSLVLPFKRHLRLYSWPMMRTSSWDFLRPIHNK